MLEFRSYQGANAGLALIRDGNGTRAFDTLMRYRNAAMAQFTRALRTLKALQAEQAAETGPALEAHSQGPAARPALAYRPQPDEPERGSARRLDYAMPAPPVAGRSLHEPAAPWLPEQHETGPRRVARAIGAGAPNEPEAAHKRAK